MEYFITGYNSRKLDNELIEEDKLAISDEREDEVRVHIFRNCELLKKETTGIFKISFEKELPRYTLEWTPVYQNGKKIFCCSNCYSIRYGKSDMEEWEKMRRLKANEMAENAVKIILGLK